VDQVADRSALPVLIFRRSLVARHRRGVREQYSRPLYERRTSAGPSCARVGSQVCRCNADVKLFLDYACVASVWLNAEEARIHERVKNHPANLSLNPAQTFDLFGRHILPAPTRNPMTMTNINITPHAIA
jgi:hypothetical protein